MRNIMGRCARPVQLLLLTLPLLACVAPVTRGVAVNPMQVEKEREYQLELTLQQQLKYQRQLDNVSWPVLKAALPICEQEFHRRQLGIDVMTLGDFPAHYRNAAKKLFFIDESLQIISTAAGSPAAAAGLLPGDRLISLNGLLLPLGQNASKGFYQQLESALQISPDVELEVKRNDTRRKIKVSGELLCHFPVHLSMDDAVNAYADGKNIVITKGMLRFAETDLEISTVVAHELGHNMMRHMDAKKSNYWLGTAADIAAALAGVNTQGTFSKMGATAYSQDFESEADYVGVYVQALAKQPIENVAQFWRRMAAEHPGGIRENHGASHPSTPERFLAIEKTVEEIHIKQKAGFPLVPDRK